MREGGTHPGGCIDMLSIRIRTYIYPNISLNRIDQPISYPWPGRILNNDRHNKVTDARKDLIEYSNRTKEEEK